MEAAARTQGDFEEVIDEWDKEDKNRERRERCHEVCRDDAEVPFEYNMSPDEIVIPAPIQSVYWQQMMKGEFLDVIFDCPYELQELVCDSSISQILSELSGKHKALFYFLYISGITGLLFCVRGIRFCVYPYGCKCIPFAYTFALVPYTLGGKVKRFRDYLLLYLSTSISIL